MPKDPIRDNEDVLTLLNNARCQRDQVIAFLFVAFGMHSKNVNELKPDDITLGQKDALLEFQRAKNAYLRSETIPRHQAVVILKWVKSGKLRKSNKTYENIIEYMGKFLTDPDNRKYLTGKVSPRSLRHTYVLNQLREFWDDTDKLDLVAAKSGCHKDTVLRYYLKLKDWIRIYKEGDKKPLDLTKFVFME